MTRKAITGALKSAIDAHGPITHELVGSAAKRVAGVALTEWAPVANAPVGEDVLCFSPDAAPEYRVMILHRFDVGDEGYAQDADAQPNAIDVVPTHWMPLPVPPLTVER